VAGAAADSKGIILAEDILIFSATGCCKAPHIPVMFCPCMISQESGGWQPFLPPGFGPNLKGA
jgi:hypothetical protein